MPKDVLRGGQHFICDWCGYYANSLGTLDRSDANPPGLGDLSICLRCSELSILRPAGWRQANPEDLIAFDQEQPEDFAELLRAQRLNRQQRALDPIPDRRGPRA